MTAIVQMKINLALVSLIFIVCCVLPSTHKLNAAEDPTLVPLKAAEHLAVLSQSIVKDYFYVSLGLNTLQARKQMLKYLKEIDENLKIIDENIKDPEFRNLITFLTITYDDMKVLLNQPYNENNAFLLMDMSEIILEGSDSIANHLKLTTKTEHRMLDLVENQLLLLERMAKFYIAARANFFDYNSQQQMNKAIEDYGTGLIEISAYTYPSIQRAKVTTLEKNWALSKYFFQKAKSGKLPRTVFLATEMMGHSLRPLIKYHAEVH